MSVGAGVDSSEQLRAKQAAIAAWKADGTPTVEPVTTSTPAAPQAAIFADAPVPTPSEVAAQIDDLKPAVAPAVEPVAVEQAPAIEPIVEPVVAPVTPAEEIEWFMGRDAQGNEFKVPASFEIPLTVDGEVSWVTIGEAQKGNMRQADYSRKTTNAADARRAGEKAQREFAANSKRLEAERALLQQDRDDLLSAASDPDAFEAHARRMQDPDYKRLYEEAREGRLATLELKFSKEEADAETRLAATADATTRVLGWIDGFSRDPRFSGLVDPERLRDNFGNALQAGTAEISETAVEQFFLAEAAAVTRATGGSAANDARFAEMQAKLDALQGNATTQHAVTRAAAPNVAPTGGKSISPMPAPQPKVRHVLAADRQAAIAAWKRG